MWNSVCAGYVLWSLTLQLLIFIEYWCCSTASVLMVFRALWTSYAIMLVPALALTHVGEGEMDPGCGVLAAGHVSYTIYAGYYTQPLGTAEHLVVTVAFTSVVGIVLLFVEYVNKRRDAALPL